MKTKGTTMRKIKHKKNPRTKENQKKPIKFMQDTYNEASDDDDYTFA